MKNVIRYFLILVIGTLVFAAVTNVTLAAFKMTPWLQAVTSNSIYVFTETDDAYTRVYVDYGTTPQYGYSAYNDFCQQTPAQTNIYRVQLTGLTPNTLYYYRVRQGGVASSNSYFRTAANPGTSYRFAWMADCRTGTSVHNSIAYSIMYNAPRFSIYGGDLCAKGTDYNSYKSEFFLSGFSPSNESALISQVPFFMTVGNHETNGATWSDVTGVNTMILTQNPAQNPQNPYNNEEFGYYYSFDYGDVHFLVLNSQDYFWNTTGAALRDTNQYKFAQWDLQNTTRRWKIVACHVPAYCAGSGHGEDNTMKQFTTEIFEPNHVDLVLAGHSHFYQHNLVNGIHHMVIGASGAPFHTPAAPGATGSPYYIIKSAQDNCFGLLDVTPTTLNLAVRNLNSQIDNITMSDTMGDWRLNGSASDQGPCKNDGIALSGVTFETDPVRGQVAKFNGSSGFIKFPNYGTYGNFNNMKAFTLAAWVRPYAHKDGNIVISKVNPNRDFVFQLTTNGKINAHFAYSATYYHCYSNVQVPVNTWSHIAAVWTGTKWQLYYNGVLDKEADFSGKIPPWTGNQMAIGCLDQLSSCIFNGRMDDVKAYKYALSPTEILNLYNSTKM